MYESEGFRKRRKNRRMMIIGAAATVLVIATTAIVVLASGSTAHRTTGCVIADVSESTLEARPHYITSFRNFATEIGTEGSGDVCLIVAAAHPITEGTPIRAYVGPKPGDAGKPSAQGDIEEEVSLATSQFTALLEEPSVDEEGSALVEAATEAARVVEPGDRILFLSDGLEWSPMVGHLQAKELNSTSIAELMQEMGSKGLLPDLEGVRVEFPYLLFHPGGLPGNEEAVFGLEEFWKAWARETGAELVLPGEQ